MRHVDCVVLPDNQILWDVPDLFYSVPQHYVPMMKNEIFTGLVTIPRHNGFMYRSLLLMRTRCLTGFKFYLVNLSAAALTFNFVLTTSEV